MVLALARQGTLRDVIAVIPTSMMAPDQYQLAQPPVLGYQLVPVARAPYHTAMFSVLIWTLLWMAHPIWASSSSDEEPVPTLEETIMLNLKLATAPVTATENWTKRFRALRNIFQCEFPSPPSESLVKNMVAQLSTPVQGEWMGVAVARKCCLHRLLTDMLPPPLPKS